MHGLWVAFKVLLSIVLLAVVGLMLFMFTRKTEDTLLLSVAAVFLFMVALLWVNLKPSRELGLVGVVLSFGFLLLGLQVFTGAHQYPRVCTGKRLWCEFENALYALGGPALAAVPFVLLGAVMLYLSARLVAMHSLPK